MLGGAMAAPIPGGLNFVQSGALYKIRHVQILWEAAEELAHLLGLVGIPHVH